MENEKEPKRLRRGKKIKLLAWIRPAALLLIMIFLFSYVTYAWMRREWTPYLSQEGITIATSGSLVFQLIGEDASSGTGMDINTILKLDKDFTLKPVSNRNGNSDGFFTMNMSGGKGQERYQYLDVSNYGGDYSKMGVENGYVEFQMRMFSPVDDGEFRYVYIHNSSFISLSKDTEAVQSDAINCIRISITVASTGQTYIFTPEVYNGVHSGVYEEVDNTTGLPAMHNVLLHNQPYNPSDPSYTQQAPVNGTNQNIVQNADTNHCVVGKFSQFDGGEYTAGVLSTFDRDATLFYFETSAEEVITVRIWAEGSHEDCTQEIAGAKIDLKLKFAAHSAPAFYS